MMHVIMFLLSLTMFERACVRERESIACESECVQELLDKDIGSIMDAPLSLSLSLSFQVFKLILYKWW